MTIVFYEALDTDFISTDFHELDYDEGSGENTRRGTLRGMFARISDMEKVENALLEMEGWSTHCAKAYSFSNASDTRCASPDSLLRFLRPNNTLEQVGSK